MQVPYLSSLQTFPKILRSIFRFLHLSPFLQIHVPPYLLMYILKLNLFLQLIFVIIIVILLIFLYKPKTYIEISSSPTWQQAMKEELQALKKNHTWYLVVLPPNKYVVRNRWVYKVKTHIDGTLECHRARVIALCFS